MKKRNLIKRNSGFVVGCVLAGGASFFAADAVMTDVIPNIHLEKETEEPQSNQTAVLESEKKETEVYETDPFTIMASGSVIKGVESEQSEKETETQSEMQQTDAQSPEDGESSGAGETDPENSADSLSDPADSGEASDGSGESDGQYYSAEASDGGSGQTIEIYDPGNGEYTYTDDGSWAGGDSGSGDGSWTDSGSGSGDGSWTDSGSGSSDGAWTPDDVIIWGISSRYIDESELYNYNQGQLRLIRNEIFALNGRIFRSQDLMDYFSQKSWYVPTYDPDEFDANMFYYLNDYEEANLQVILNYEAALGY